MESLPQTLSFLLLESPSTGLSISTPGNSSRVSQDQSPPISTLLGHVFPHVSAVIINYTQITRFVGLSFHGIT